jgi:hypothetical protein
MYSCAAIVLKRVSGNIIFSIKRNGDLYDDKGHFGVVSPFHSKHFRMIVAYFIFIDPRMISGHCFSLVTGEKGPSKLQFKRGRGGRERQMDEETGGKEGRGRSNGGEEWSSTNPFLELSTEVYVSKKLCNLKK